MRTANYGIAGNQFNYPLGNDTTNVYLFCNIPKREYILRGVYYFFQISIDASLHDLHDPERRKACFDKLSNQGESEIKGKNISP